MAALVDGSNVSEGWVKAVETLLVEPTMDMSNLCVCVRNPVEESVGVRDSIERFRERLDLKGRDVPRRVETVAGTIFPTEFYIPHVANPAEHLFFLERKTRSAVRRHRSNRKGTYFGRLVAYPAADGSELNQLERALAALQRLAERGIRNDNRLELAFYSPNDDTNLVGFPCLSHVSLTLNNGRLDGTALYRNQYFIERAYGNILGLGRLMAFLAAESGYQLGELVCIASHARLETDFGGRSRIQELVTSCRSELESER